MPSQRGAGSIARSGTHAALAQPPGYVAERTEAVQVEGAHPVMSLSSLPYTRQASGSARSAQRRAT